MIPISLFQNCCFLANATLQKAKYFEQPKENAMVDTPRFLCFGEIIFDQIDGKYFLGGASLNFAWYTSQVYTETAIVSSIGKDSLGELALSNIQKTKIEMFVHINELKTGTAIVDKTGHFQIITPAAWERIQVPEIEKKDFDLLYLGTLAQITSHNKKSLDTLLSLESKRKFVDINLRYPFYTETIIAETLLIADILKVNENEWTTIKKIIGISSYSELIHDFNISVFVITRGSRGANLYTKSSKFHYCPQYTNNTDSTGAGDAFSAILARGICGGMDYTQTLELACDAGAFVASRKGAQILLPKNIENRLKYNL